MKDGKEEKMNEWMNKPMIKLISKLINLNERIIMKEFLNQLIFKEHHNMNWSVINQSI